MTTKFTTAELQKVATFLGASWHRAAVVSHTTHCPNGSWTLTGAIYDKFTELGIKTIHDGYLFGEGDPHDIAIRCVLAYVEGEEVDA